MSTNPNAYIDYFRQLAVKHKDLLHDVASEDGDAPPHTKHFTRWSVEEAVTGLRHKVGYPCLMLEMFEAIHEAEMVFDIKGKFKGAFTVVDHTSGKQIAEETEALQKCYTILMDLLKKIWQDHYGSGANRCSSPMQDFDFNGLEIMPVGPILSGTEYGWRCEFAFMFRQNENITQPPAEGTFID